MPTLPSLRPNGDVSLTTWTRSTGSTTHTLISDDPDTPTTASYVQTTVTTAGSVVVELTNTPSDFDTMTSISVRGRWAANASDDQITLAFEVISSAGTVLAGGGVRATGDGNGSVAARTDSQTTLTSAGSSASKATWDAARFRISGQWTNNMAADAGRWIRVYDVEVDGVYTARGTAPVLVAPANNSTSDGTSFEWDFQPVGGETQARYALRVAAPADWSTVVSGTPTLEGNGFGVAFNPAGTRLAVGHSNSPRLRVLNTSDWSTVSGTPTLAGIGNGVAFNPAGTRLAAALATTPFLTVVNTSDWSTVSGTPTLAGIGNGVAFSPDGSLLAVAHNVDPYLTVLNTSDWSTVSGTPTLGGNGFGVAFSPDGSLLAAAFINSPRLRVYNTSDWSTVSGTPTLASTGRGVAFNPAGTRLAVGHEGTPFLRVLNTSDWSTVSGTPTLAGTGIGVAFSPDGTRLAVGHFASPRLTVVNTSDWSTVSGTPTLADTGRGVAFSPDGSLLAVGHEGTPFLTVIDEAGTKPWWWNGTAFAATETFVTSTAETATIPAAAWDDIL